MLVSNLKVSQHHSHTHTAKRPTPAPPSDKVMSSVYEVGRLSIIQIQILLQWLLEK